MTKRDLIVRISKKTGIIQEDVNITIQTFLDYIAEALAEGHHVEFRDFGVFEVRLQKPRIGRNPNKPEDVVQIPARNVVKFKASKKMKAMLAAAAAQAPATTSVSIEM